jgi:8-oxo-dGTP pyrophosphatase MutT (NUDIX family)
MKLLKQIQKEEVTEYEMSLMNTRHAARAVIFDGQKIALMHVKKVGYYKLPGGGIDDGESNISGLKRECMEEVGASVDQIKEIGKIVEIIKYKNIIQTSYCYVANLVGELKENSLTKKEEEEGFEVVWVTLDKALELVDSNQSKFGVYVREREVAILNEVKKII